MSAPNLVTGSYSHSLNEKLRAEKGYNYNEHDDEDEDCPVPDGGWGWMVCMASFLVNFIVDGTMFSFGILLLELLDDFQETKALTSWVGSALLGMSMMMGPVVSLLLKHFSIRQVTIAGTMVSTVGFISSVFAPNIYVLILMYGVVGGIGFCMIFLPAIIVVGLYFSKRRAIATGISTSGSGMGTFAYAYLCDQLLRVFTWRQTILILTGILLNCVACGMIFRPLMPMKRKRKRNSCTGDDSGSSSSSDKEGNSSCGSGSSTFYEFEDGETTAMVQQQKKRCSGSGMGFCGQRESSSCEWLHQSTNTKPVDAVRKIMKEDEDTSYPLSSASGLNHNRHRHHRQYHHHHHKRLSHPKVCDTSSVVGGEAKSVLSPILALDERLHRSVDDFSFKKNLPVSSNYAEKMLYFSETQLVPGAPSIAEVRPEVKEHITMGLMRPILRKDIYYSGSVSHLAEYQQCGRSMTSFLAQMTQPVSDDSGLSVSTGEPETEARGHKQRKCSKWLRGVVAWDLFKNPAFLCLLVTFTMWTVQSVPLTYLPNLAVSKGVPRDQAAFLISIVGITNTAGRILAGVITDVFRVRSITLYVIALFLASAVIYGIPWCYNFSLLASASAVFGLCMAVTVSMRTIVLTEQLGIGVLTQSFGVVALFQGLAFTVNPPIAGKLFDETGAFFWPFIMAGTMYLISALTSLVVKLCFKPLPEVPAIIVDVEEIVAEPIETGSDVSRLEHV